MSRFVFSLIIGGLLLIWTGCHSIYEAVSAGAKQTISYEEFVRRHPRTGWYRITGAMWDMEYRQYDSTTDRYSHKTTVYLPVHAANRQPSDVLISVIAETDRSDIQKFVNADARSDNGPLPIPDNLAHYTGDIEGTVAVPALWGDSPEQGMRRRLGGVLAPNPVVIRVGKKPNAGPGFLSVLGGIALVGAGTVLLIRRKRF